MKDIKIISRYNDEYKLIQVEGDLYKADFGTMYEWTRFGGDGIGGYYDFVDPPGGPFLHVGYKFPDGKILSSIKIDNGIYLTLVNEENNQ